MRRRVLSNATTAGAVPVIVAAALSVSCASLERTNQESDDGRLLSDAEALLTRVRSVLPGGWEASLCWRPAAPDPRLGLEWLDDEWLHWLPGTDGSVIMVSRRDAVTCHLQVDGPLPDATYVRKVQTFLSFALTLCEVRTTEEVGQRLAGLEKSIDALERVLWYSMVDRGEDGYARHTAPGDDGGRRALDEYEGLWAVKRMFPQWQEGRLLVGFRNLPSMPWPGSFPADAQKEYRSVREKVVGALHPIEGWTYIPEERP